MMFLAILAFVLIGFVLLVRWAANEPSLTYGQRDLYRDYIRDKKN